MNKETLKKGLLGSIVLAVVGASGAADAGGKHACLAYNESTHHYGWAVDQPDAATASAKAVAACGAGCTPRLNWDSGCGAYAEGQKNIHYGWATGPTKDAVTASAINACTKGGGVNCTIRNWACN
jgi:hypothetical protein